MPILRLEHPVPDFDAWRKEGLDSDPLGREKGGVRRYQVLRDLHDPKYALVDLEFDTLDEAEVFRAALRDLWGRVQARFGWTESPRARIVENVETKEY